MSLHPYILQMYGNVDCESANRRYKIQQEAYIIILAFHYADLDQTKKKTTNC